MQPGDFLADNLNIPLLAVEALHEHEVRTVVRQLDSLFSVISEPVAIDAELGKLPEKLDKLTGSYLNSVGYFEMSEPYDSFEHNDVVMDSRIIRLLSMGGGGYCYSQIYLFGLMGEKQKSISVGNCPFGALATSDGDVVLFKIEENPNIGEVIPRFKSVDTKTNEVINIQGPTDEEFTKLAEASYAEQYVILREFKKALDTLAVPVEVNAIEEIPRLFEMEPIEPQSEEQEWEQSSEFETELEPDYEEGQEL